MLGGLSALIVGLGSAFVASVCAGSTSAVMWDPNSASKQQIVLASDETVVTLCIPDSLDQSVLPDDHSITFLVKPMPSGTVRFLHKHEPRGLAHVEQVRVAPFRTTAIWTEVLAEMRGSLEHEVLSGFVFETVFRTNGSQMYAAASSVDPVNLLISLRDDGADRELRESQLASIASSVSDFMKTKKCN